MLKATVRAEYSRCLTVHSSYIAQTSRLKQRKPKLPAAEWGRTDVTRLFPGRKAQKNIDK
jgi:hypothetical protein